MAQVLDRPTIKVTYASGGEDSQGHVQNMTAGIECILGIFADWEDCDTEGKIVLRNFKPEGAE